MKKQWLRHRNTVQSVLEVNCLIQYRITNVGENAINGVNMMASY